MPRDETRGAEKRESGAAGASESDSSVGQERRKRRALRWCAAVLSALATVPVAAPAQGPCVPAPLFSGNVVLRMPQRPEPQYPNVGINAWSRALGDFNNDDRLDLIFGSAYGSLVYFRGQASWWKFDAPVIIELPWAQPPPGESWLITSLAAADFNDDGNLDLAVWDRRALAPPMQRLHVILGNGNGTFGPPIVCGPVTPTDYLRGEMRVEDFDGNGTLDIMCGYGTSLMLLRGAGNGTFPAFEQAALMGDDGHFDAADIDGDGDIDAVVGPIEPPNPLAVSARILRNNGSGAFVSEPLNFSVSDDKYYTFGELNGDNRPDLVFAASDGLPGGAPELLCAALNDGTGHFPSFSQYTFSTHPDMTAVGSAPLVTDLDGDGRAEVAVVRRGLWSGTHYFTDQIVIFENAGDGTLVVPPAVFHGPKMIYNDFNPPLLASADLNQDGRYDVVAANQFMTTLILNDGAGGLMTEHGTPMGQQLPDPSFIYDGMTKFDLLTPGDINGDGKFDLVGVRHALVPPECTIMLQDNQGAFTSLFSLPLPDIGTNAIALADFDRDGNLDIALARSTGSLPCGGDEVWVALGNGNGTFDPWAVYHAVGKAPQHVAAGDLNGDLFPDMVICEASGANCPSSLSDPRGVSVLLNEGDGTFAAAVQYNIDGQCNYADIADLNGDGHRDIAVAWGRPGPSARGVAVLLNDGDGTFTPLPNSFVYTAGLMPTRVTLADVNADLRPDLFVVPQHEWFLPPATGGLLFALNNGNGSFGPGTHLDPMLNYASKGVHAADFDGDGDADIAIACPSYDSIHIYQGNGNGSFAPFIAYGGAGRFHGGEGLIVEDFDGDGRLDLGSPLGCTPDWDRADYMGFARLYNRTCPVCYPDCNSSGQLTVADFTCFQSRFVAGDPYADCNQSGGLTVADFTCFQTKFVAGCP